MNKALKSLNPYRQKLFYVYGIISITVLLLSTIVFVNFQNDTYSEEIINDVFKTVEADLSELINPINKSLLNIKANHLSGAISFDNIAAMNQYFSGLLENLEGVSSLFIGDNKGHQYTIYKDKKTWVSGTRLFNENESRIEWKRWKVFSNSISEWAEVINYDPINEDWYRNLNISFSDFLIWTQAHQIFSTKEIGTTGLVTWQNIEKQDTLYCAMNLSLRTLNAAVSKLNSYNGRKLFLLTQNNYYIEIPEKGDSLLTNFSSFINYKSGLFDKEIDFILDEWHKLGNKCEVPFSFSGREDLFWNRIEKINTQNSILKAGISISESELLFISSKNYYILLIVIGLILAAQIVFLIIYELKKKEFQTVLNETQVWKEYSVSEIESLVKQGENNSVEFKSSLRWDYREEKVNKHLEEVILKSVAAFNNGEGGTLVIGVDDDQNILGLENDYLTLKKKNIDYFEIHIRNLFNQMFGINFTTTNLKISFPNYEEKVICVIEIMKGETPIFLTLTDAKGRRTENFFIRSGNTSQKVESLTEINNYISKRFNSSNSL